MYDKRHLHRCEVERRLCITGRRSTQSDASVRVLTAHYFPAAVMDQKLVDNRRVFHTPRAFDAAVNFKSFE